MTRAVQFRDQFQAFAAGLNGESRRWTHALRLSAFRTFEQLGLPTTDLEAWKHTDIEPLLSAPLRLAGEPPRLGRGDVEALGLHAPGVPRLVVVDGVVAPELGDALGEGVRLVPIGADTLRPHLGRIDGDALVALNTAFLRGGVALQVAPGVAAGPLHVVWVSTGGGGPSVRHPRLLVVAEAASRLTLLESWVGHGGGDYLVNAVSELVLGRGARVEVLRLVDESGSHVGATEARLGADSLLRSHVVTVGGTLAREALTVRLEGERAHCELGGLYVASGRQHVDNTTVIDHAAPRCTSREYYKGIVGGSASSIFYGKVLVRQDAQKSDASQKNKNLVVSKGAQANTRPQLEIYADDVKCAHGATVGQLDELQLFYLRSRGIGLEEARRELTLAFAKEVVDGIDGRFRDGVERLVRERLPLGE